MTCFPHQEGWRLAAPSFVMPGTVAENCRFLAGSVDEVALCFFETRACLDYGDDDLPPWLADLQGRSGALRFHVHLPLDLPWEKGGRHAAEAAASVARKADFLSPRAFVLHPPAEKDELASFLEVWRREGFASGELLLENTEDNGLAETSRHAYVFDCGICLDFGHALAFDQTELLEAPHVLERVRMLHVYAPGGHTGGRHRHLPLDTLSPEQDAMLQDLLERLAPGMGRTLVLELFDWGAFQNSAPRLEKWTGSLGADERE